MVEIYTDGACSGNPGPGGWAAILTCSGREKELSGSVESSTSNQMELTAILEGLSYLTPLCLVTVYTDSANCIGWLAKGWKRKNKDIQYLCSRIDKVVSHNELTVLYKKVKAHNGNEMNERVDRLAVSAATGGK